jgi:hypothetical protein
MSRKNKDLVGNKINNLDVIAIFPSNGRQFFECNCFCGNTFTVRADRLKDGGRQSCGCIKGDIISQKNRLADNKGITNLVLKSYKDNAKKRKLNFELSIEEFNGFIFSNCYYCGQEPQLVKFTGYKNRRDRFISYNGIDRIDNNKGYILSNCVSCCKICNGAKSDYSFEEFRNWIKRLVSFNNGK